MTQRPRTGRPTRAEAIELDDRLRRAAVASFLEHGFDGTTMEGVAAAAGISKRTLYTKHPDKRTLFANVLPWAMSNVRWEMPELDPDVDLSVALLTIGRAAVERVSDPAVVQLSRMAMTEAHRFPEFAEAARTLSWSPRLRAVIDLLDRHARAGHIVVEDLELTAEHFLAMVSGFPALLALFGGRRDRALEERHLEHAVHLFLAALEPR